MAWGLWRAGWLVVLCGCEVTASEVLVAVDSDLSDAVSFRFAIVDGEDDERAVYRVFERPAGFTFGIAPFRDDPARSVVIRGQALQVHWPDAEREARATDVLVERIARVGFVRGRRILLRLFFATSCVEREPCAGETSCDRGVCVPIDIPAESLPVVEPGADAGPLPPPVDADAGIDGSAPDATRDSGASTGDASLSDASLSDGGAPDAPHAAADASPDAGPAEVLGPIPLEADVEGARFGQRAALSGDGRVRAVSATGYDGCGLENAGAVFVFDAERLQERLCANELGGGAGFGEALAVSYDGARIAVGASDNRGGVGGEIDVDSRLPDSGSVSVFVLEAGEWLREDRFKEPVAMEEGNFGDQLAFSADGNWLAVGASRDQAIPALGAAYLYERVDRDWRLRAEFPSPAPMEGSRFGTSIAMDDDASILVVGASHETVEGQANAGVVYVYRRVGGAWSETPANELRAQDPGPEERFGLFIAMDAAGTRLVVGAEQDRREGSGISLTEPAFCAGCPATGAMYVYRWDRDEWLLEAHLRHAAGGDGDRLGDPVRLSGDGATLLAGACQEDSADPSDPTNTDAMSAGAAYVFRRDGTSWEERAYLKAPEPEAHARFGVGAALSANGQHVVIGAQGSQMSDAASGAFYFRLP